MRIAEFGMRNSKKDPEAKARKDRYARGKKPKDLKKRYSLFVIRYWLKDQSRIKPNRASGPRGASRNEALSVSLEERLSASRSRLRLRGASRGECGLRIAEFGMRNNKNDPKAKIRKEGVT